MRFIVENNTLYPEKIVGDSPALQPIGNIEQIPQKNLNQTFVYNEELQTILSGKSLLLDELTFSIRHLQEHYENGHIKYKKGITMENSTYRCERCGNQDQFKFATFYCARCHSDCTYCRNCIMMGIVSQCTPLITWCGPQPQSIIQKEPLAWEGILSEGQQAASNKVIEAIKKEEELLVWAVCGAGKTEVLFHGISTALKSGKRVCIATPRTDVVLELAPRIRKVFPGVSLAVLYGGSEDKYKYADLTLSTTHQLYRFEQAFDVMVVDEVDAFPYSFDHSLKFAVQKARKTNSTIVHLTATPDKKTQILCKRQKLNHIKIPARFHRYPLPLPTFKWCGNWKKSLEKQKLPKVFLKWITGRLNKNIPALIFLPDISSLQMALAVLQSLHPDIQSVHAADPDRKQKVEDMRQKRIPMLLTTTILERGVTIPGIDVAVIGADADIFTESALVQISGRVGRSSKQPTGNITFFHNGRTTEMIRALVHIYEMNQEGKQRGLLDE